MTKALTCLFIQQWLTFHCYDHSLTFLRFNRFNGSIGRGCKRLSKRIAGYPSNEHFTKEGSLPSRFNSNPSCTFSDTSDLQHNSSEFSAYMRVRHDRGGHGGRAFEAPIIYRFLYKRKRVGTSEIPRSRHTPCCRCKDRDRDNRKRCNLTKFKISTFSKTIFFLGSSL